MEEDKNKLITLFERKINLLLEKNEGYAQFKGASIQGKIKEVLSREPLREDIVGLGFLLHLYALKLRLAMYKNLIPFTMLNFKKDLQEIINTLHAYQRHRNPGIKPLKEFPEAIEIKSLIPPLVDMRRSKRTISDNFVLYSVILDILKKDDGEVDLEIPEDIIMKMQSIDLKRIYTNLLNSIEKERGSTVRELARKFPIFENDRLSLVVVFNEVLFLANEGKVFLRQIEGDIGIRFITK